MSVQTLIEAIYRKDQPAILANDAYIDAQDSDGRTPLMHAVLSESADPTIVKVLASRSRNPSAPDTGQQWTALHFAARDQKPQIVRVLLDCKVSVDPVDVFGNTPLWRCIMNRSPNPEIVKMLITSGADARRKNKSGVSPLDIATRTRQLDLLQLLQ